MTGLGEIFVVYVGVFVHLLCQHVRRTSLYCPHHVTLPWLFHPRPRPHVMTTAAHCPHLVLTHPPVPSTHDDIASPSPTSSLHTRCCRYVALIPSLHMRQQRQWCLVLVLSLLTHRMVTQAQWGCCGHPIKTEMMVDPARLSENCNG